MAIKAWFMIRRDLGMSTGKVAIQVGHGTDLIHLAQPPHYQRWLDPEQGNRRKILCSVSGEAMLNVLRRMLSDMEIRFADIADAGLTELGGPTVTGIVVMPMPEEHAPLPIRRASLWRDKPARPPIAAPNAGLPAPLADELKHFAGRYYGTVFVNPSHQGSAS